MAHHDDDAWFAPARCGYGAGLPIHPAGWGLLAGFILTIALATLLLPYSLVGYLAVVAAATAALILISAQKTRGGWRWRWERNRGCGKADPRSQLLLALAGGLLVVGAGLLATLL